MFDTMPTAKMLSVKNISHFLFLAALFCLPFQIFTILYDASAYSSGLFLIYQSFPIYLSDILFISSFIVCGIDFVKHKKSWNLGNKPIAIALLFLFIFAEISCFFAKDQLLAFLQLFRLAEYIGIYFYIIQQKIPTKSIVQVITASLILQIFIALYQFSFQSSIGLSFLGEPQLNTHIPGIAKFLKDGVTMLRPYGTFPHPNILAGILVCCFFLLKYLKTKFLWLIRIIFLIGILISFSRTAWLALLIGFLSYIFIFRHEASKTQKRIEILIFVSIIALLLPILWFRWETMLEDGAIIGRIELMKNSLNMLLLHPLGVGLSHFTLALPDVASQYIAPWNIQPVHNFFLLAANETGILGGLSMTGIIFYTIHKCWKLRENKDCQTFGTLFVAITVLMLADHYFWDIVSGSVYLWVFLGMGIKTFSPKLPEPQQDALPAL